MKKRVNPITPKRGRPCRHGNKMRARSVSLSDDSWECLRREADRTERSVNQVVDIIVRDVLGRLKKRKSIHD